MTPSRWLLPCLDSDAAAALAAELGLLAPVARVLWARGYRDADAARRFLQPAISDLLDPMQLAGMDRAVERLLSAIQGGEKILLYGDYDVDGVSSIVILKKVLDIAGGRCDFHVPHRLRDGYGMREDVIDRAAADGYSLVISVDTGIRAAQVVAHARTRNIDVIVTDHHLPEKDLPPAVAVLNPNRSDCGYPEKNLCGAGVVFKLVQALMARLEWPSARVNAMTGSFLKLTALATIADVVPLTGENRAIVRLGLDGFDTVRNPGLRALLRVAGIREGQRPSSTEVAFQIAPPMNAAGRMASAEDVINLFLTNDSSEADRLAALLQNRNADRRETEAAITTAIFEACAASPVTDSERALVFSGSGWHKGVVGIVASRLVERYHRPVFVLCEEHETGLAQGSGRGIPAFHLLESLESMPELFTKFGGHKQAAGVTLPLDRVDEFRRRLLEFAGARLTLEDLQPVISIDAPIALNEINDRSVREVLSLAPFGLGNPPPVFSAMDARLAGPPGVWKEKHLRVAMSQNGRTVIAKAWNFAGRASEFHPGAGHDFAFCLGEDAYEGKWSVTLKDVRSSMHADAAGQDHRFS